jgi:hypothetical protein
MNTKTTAIIGLVSILVAMCLIVPAVAQPTPVYIYGFACDNESTPVCDLDVTVTNLNTSEVFTAETNASSNFYQLVLNNSSEVQEGNTLRLIAVNESSTGYHIINVTTYKITAAELNAGGIFNLNLTLDEFYLNLVDFPMSEANASACPNPGDEEHKMCGPATAQMNLDYMWWNSSEETEPQETHNQSYLYEYGISNNNNTNLEYFDVKGMWATIQYLDPPSYSEYGYNFGKYHNADLDTMMKSICHWICYTVGWVGGHKEGHPYHVPGAVPAYGDYTNWMSIRGLHTNKNAAPSTWVTPDDLEVYGFWVNDPHPDGIGENSYKTAEEWTETYYKPLDTNDTWDGEYVAILEPPEEDVGDITIISSKERFDIAIVPMQMEKMLMVYEVEQLALEKVVTDDESLKIVKAAIEGVTEELIPYDTEFAAVFAKTSAGAPMLVTSDNGDYYLVPFNVPVIERQPLKKVPVEIERVKASGFKKFERVKSLAANTVIEPIVIEPIKVERTFVVVRVDAEDGSFKEASWVADPVKYLPVSKIEALKLALSEVQITSASGLSNLQSKPNVELVYRDASPYYPDWKITVDGTVFFVGQDGTVSS